MKTIVVDANADSRKKVKRPGSGRTKGSFSFVTVSLADLKANFADDTQKIVIGRKWAEQCGFNIQATTPATDILGKIQGETPATQAAVTVRNLADEE
jgi:hypothetical protein